MSDQPESLVLVFLRRLDAKMDAAVNELRDVKHRVTALEISIANLAATEASHYASVAARLDRAEARLDRIERRLDLTEAATA